MTALFSSVIDLNQDVIRNIVNMLSAQNAFDDLTDDSDDAYQIAENAMQRVMQQTGMITSDLHFHYTAAIDYPFATDHFMATRYSDGTFPVWYGSVDKITSIYETAYHMYRREMQVEGAEFVEEIIRERLVYDIKCEAMLIDLTMENGKRDQLIQDEYAYTQIIGKKIYEQGFPGLLVPSARHADGVNVSVFKAEVLKQPRVNCMLTYRLQPQQQKLDVYQKGRLIQTISW